MEDYKSPEFIPQSEPHNTPVQPNPTISDNTSVIIENEKTFLTSNEAINEEKNETPSAASVPPYVPHYNPQKVYPYAQAPIVNQTEHTGYRYNNAEQTPPVPPRPDRGTPSSFTINGGNTSRQEYKSGEYRYVPPYAGVGANVPHQGNQQNQYAAAPQPPQRSEEPKKEKKEKTVRTFSTTALVFILIGAVLLSFASGMMGALLVEGGLSIENSASSDNDNSNNSSGDLVINKADDDDDDKAEINDLEGDFGSSYDLSDICAVVSASVVEISTEFNQTAYGYYQYVQEGAGSGVIISEDGYLLTNAHVITNSDNGKTADTIKVRLTSGDEYTAKIIGNDPDSDIALLKIDGKNLSAATVGNSDSIKVGEQVIAVGNPLGELGGTVTSGIVSATNREISVENNKMTLIQIDAAINPGNSGGGLFNTDGELIGIVNAKTTDVTVEGLGFAIPVNEAINVAEELKEHGYVTGKTHIGISLADVTDAFTAYYNFRSQATGVYIVMVQEGYNDNVLKYGDRITAIDDKEITSSEDVKEIIKSSEVGDKLTFTVSRDGKLIDVEVTCYEYVPQNDISFDNN